MPTRVIWPTYNDTNAYVWRLIDLTGMEKGNIWEGRYTMYGYVYLDGNRVKNKKQKVKIGKQFNLQLRIPGRLVDSRDLIVVTNQFLESMPYRLHEPYEF